MNDLIPFGKYAKQGLRWHEAPAEWLSYVARGESDIDIKYVHRAIKELHNKGLAPPDMRIYMTAINSVSMFCLDLFFSRQDKTIGIYTWLLINARLALENGIPITINPGLLEYNGMVFKFKLVEPTPILLKVTKSKKELDNVY